MPRRGQGELHNSAVIANTPVLDVMDEEWTGESDQGRTVSGFRIKNGSGRTFRISSFDPTAA